MNGKNMTVRNNRNMGDTIWIDGLEAGGSKFARSLLVRGAMFI